MPLGEVSFIPAIEADFQMRNRAGHLAAIRGGPDRARGLGCRDKIVSVRLRRVRYASR